MATFTKVILSGSTDGRSIPVSATAGAITIHTATSSTSVLDEVYLWAQNNFSQAIDVVIEFGVSNSQVHMASYVEARSGPQLIVPGLLLRGAATPQVVGAFIQGLNGSSSGVASSSYVSVNGYINRIS